MSRVRRNGRLCFTLYAKPLIQVMWAPVLVFTLHQISLLAAQNTYWWDEWMHLLGGLAIARMTYTLLDMVQHKGLAPRLPLWVIGGLILGSVLLFGVMWEWFEWFLWVYIDPSIGLTLDDTLKDLANDVAGGLLFLIGWIVVHEEGGS